jgi:class 3 adenylate cyclase
MRLSLTRLYRRLGARYFWLFIGFEVSTALTVCLATVGLFALYEPMDAGTFWRIVAISELCVVAALVYTVKSTKRMAAPLVSWVKAGRPLEGAEDAWRVAAALPREFVQTNGWQPWVIIALPLTVFIPLELGLPIYSSLIVAGGAMVAIAYASILHFFASEAFLRPIVTDISGRLGHDFSPRAAGVPLRWKLLGALPLINVVTGVVVSGLSTSGRSSLDELGFDVVVAVLVAFTISLELTVLLTKSLLGPIDDLLEATRRVGRGDLDARVPLTSADELGALAASFNDMVHGLSEREALRDALGSYVDPEVAERVLQEGELLEGIDAEATILFVDIRDFTPFAERSSARETVAQLNEFFDLVVPVVLEHGGHANKFLGDGLLCVFGPPEGARDHADRALGAACAIASAVERRFGDELRVGVGLNSGPVVVGSVGGGGRLEFAVIGDAVNVAARVESCTRETGDVVMLTEATRCLLENSGIELEPRGELDLKGKSDPVKMYAVAGLVDSRREGRAPLAAEA